MVIGWSKGQRLRWKEDKRKKQRSEMERQREGYGWKGPGGGKIEEIKGKSGTGMGDKCTEEEEE